MYVNKIQIWKIYDVDGSMKFTVITCLAVRHPRKGDPNIGYPLRDSGSKFERRLGGVARPAAASSGYISEPFHGHVKVLLTKRILPYLGPHKIWKISDGNSSK